MIQVAFGAADILFGSLIAGSLAGLAVLGHLRAVGNRDDENKTLRRRLSGARNKLADAAELQAIADKKAQMLREARDQLRESRIECERLQDKVDHLNVAVRAADEIVVEHFKWTFIETELELWNEPPEVVAQFTPEKMTRRMLERTTLAQIHDLLAYAEGPLVDYAAAIGFHAFPPDTEFNPDKLPDGFPKKVIDDIEDLPYVEPDLYRQDPRFATGESPRITAAETSRMMLPYSDVASHPDDATLLANGYTRAELMADIEAMLNGGGTEQADLRTPVIPTRTAKPKSRGRK